jgi:phytoene dehydrogenase-like protein
MAGTEYDALVIGGGHQGMIHAAYLAKGGLRPLVLEQRPFVGGAAITEPLHPGFSFTTFSYGLSLLRNEVIQELELVKFGYQPLFMPTSFTPMDNGDYLFLGDDHDLNIKEISRHSVRDADAYDRYQYDFSRVKQFVKPIFDRRPPNFWSDRAEDRDEITWLLGHLGSAPKKVIHDAVRLITGSAADFLDDYFESEIIKGAFAGSGIIGTKVGPMSPGSGLVMLYMGMGEHDGDMGGWSFHKGGNGGLMQVISRAAQAVGVEVRHDSVVDHVLVENGRAVGVVLRDGVELRAGTVVSSLDPRHTFLDLVDPRELPADLVDDVRRFRFQGTASKVNFALDDLPRYPALGDRTDIYRGFVSVSPSIEYLERAFDAAKYGWYSEKPYLDACFQSVIDPDMAPPGKHVLSCFTMYTPYELRGSDWDTERENLGDTVQRRLDELFPGFSDLVLHREVVTPLDIERTTGLSEGNIYAGEFLLPQMWAFRPAPGYTDYRTPIEGYYQCGSGTHPGGCVIGSPARFASQAVLADRAEA